jgi:hypothetical protein
MIKDTDIGKEAILLQKGKRYIVTLMGLGCNHVVVYGSIPNYSGTVIEGRFEVYPQDIERVL